MATYTYRKEPLVTCPYNPAHQVKKGRYQIHITKCRKAYPDKDLRQCPYSAEHLVPASDYMHHMYTCPLNTTVARFLTDSDADKLSGNVSLPSYVSDTGTEFPSEENWDDDVSGATSLEDKIKAPAVAPLFVNVQAMLPAERRRHYASLHADRDQLLPESMAPKTLDSVPTLNIPPQPTTQPKILQRFIPRQTAKQIPLSTESDSDDSDDDDDDNSGLNACRMGLGRGFPRSLAATSENGDEEMDTRMRLLGLGRGRGLPRK